MKRLADWFRRRVKDPLIAELKQGSTAEGVAAAVSVSFAISINPIIGTTTVLCLLAGRLFRLNHVVMQVVNHLLYPLQILLIVPFVRLGEAITGAEPVALSPSAIIEEFTRSFSGFIHKFGMAYVHGIIGWLIIVPLVTWGFNYFLRLVFRRLMPKFSQP